MEVAREWRQGILYPRWAALAHYGYGEPRFIFYPPASWVIGAALGTLLPWKVVPGIYVWLALTLSGCSMFVLARRWFNRADAAFAAIAYVTNPYYIVMVYWRSAYAELLAGAVLPLFLLCIAEIDKDRRKLIPLSLLIAAAALTNIPAFVMVGYSSVLLALILAIERRSPGILLRVALAGMLGAALAAFYLLPAYCEQKWVNLAQVLSPGVRPEDNFLFTTIADPDHNLFNRLVSVVGMAELVMLALAALFAWRRRENRHLWGILAIWSFAAAFLMFAVSSLFWLKLPLLRFMQLPWRWLLCVDVALAIFVTMSSRRWLVRSSVFLFVLAVFVWTCAHILPPWWSDYRDFADMSAAQMSGAGYEGTDEYAPAGADPYNIDQHAAEVASDSGAPFNLNVQNWAPELKRFTVRENQADKLVLRLFNYPAWEVEVNGYRVKAEARNRTGQMIVPIAAGDAQVRVRFVRTWDRTVGGLVSLVTGLGLAFWHMRRRAHQI